MIGDIDKRRLEFHQRVQDVKDGLHTAAFKGGSTSKETRVLPLARAK